MGRDLLSLPPFRASIDKTANTLKKLGLDLYAIFESNDKTVFDNVLNSFVGIAAIQVKRFGMLGTSYRSKHGFKKSKSYIFIYVQSELRSSFYIKFDYLELYHQTNQLKGLANRQ